MCNSRIRDLLALYQHNIDRGLVGYTTSRLCSTVQRHVFIWPCSYSLATPAAFLEQQIDFDHQSLQQLYLLVSTLFNLAAIAACQGGCQPSHRSYIISIAQMLSARVSSSLCWPWTIRQSCYSADDDFLSNISCRSHQQLCHLELTFLCLAAARYGVGWLIVYRALVHRVLHVATSIVACQLSVVHGQRNNRTTVLTGHLYYELWT